MEFLHQAASYMLGTLAARGWNYNNIRWMTSLEEGRTRAIESRKPAMVVVHRTNCPTCMALKPRFKNNRDIERLAKEFVMINIEDEKEHRIAELNADGDYVPRILFLDANGKLLRQVKNVNSEYGKYFHIDSNTILRSMKHALTVSGQSTTTLLQPSRPDDIRADANPIHPSIPRPAARVYVNKSTNPLGARNY